MQQRIDDVFLGPVSWYLGPLRQGISSCILVLFSLVTCLTGTKKRTEINDTIAIKFRSQNRITNHLVSPCRSPTVFWGWRRKTFPWDHRCWDCHCVHFSMSLAQHARHGSSRWKVADFKGKQRGREREHASKGTEGSWVGTSTWGQNDRNTFTD